MALYLYWSTDEGWEYKLPVQLIFDSMREYVDGRILEDEDYEDDWSKTVEEFAEDSFEVLEWLIGNMNDARKLDGFAVTKKPEEPDLFEEICEQQVRDE